MVLNQSKETLIQGTEEVMVKISDLPKHGIQVSEEFVKKYWEQLITKKELGELFTKKTAEEQQNSLKWLLKLRFDVYKTAQEWIETNQEHLRFALKKWKEAAKKSSESAEELFEKSVENLSQSNVWVKTKEAVIQVKEKIKQWGFLIGLEKAAKSWWILWFFAGLFLGIMKLFGYNEKIGELWEKVAEVLNPEQIEKTKIKVKKHIIDSFWETLTDENKGKLWKSLDNLTQEQFLKLSEKLKKGELNLTDISSIIPNIWNEFLKEEQIEKIQQDFQAKIIESIKKEIAEKYSVDLNWNEARLKDLEILVRNNTTISDETIWKFIKIQNEEEFLLKDLFWPTFEWIINSTSLLIGLLTKQIIPISAFWLEFAEAWTEVIKISASAMWVSKVINIEMFNKSIENLNETEKALMIWLLYRKWWLFLSIIWSISESISRIWIESLTNTQVKTTNLLSASLSNNYNKQIENFEKIAKSLWWYKKQWTILKEAQRNLNKIKENYKILNILEQSKWNTTNAIKLLKEAKITNLPDSNLPFDDFVKAFKNSTSSVLTDLFSKWSMTSSLWFWAEADLFRLNKKLETISKAQRKMFEWNFITKNIWKLRELMNIWEVSRLWDRMVLHFESIDKAKQWVSKLNILANKFPDIIKWTLDKLPIIAVTWIAANSDKPFFEEFKKELKYLFPIVWPIMLVSNSGINWKDWKPKVVNAVDAWIWWALLTVDWLFLMKELGKNWVRGWLSYIIKPITDIYSLWKWTAEWAYSIWKVAVNWKSFSWILKQSISKTKFIKKPKLRTIAILIWLWYLWLEAAFAEDNLELIFWKDWKMDKKQLKAEISKLSDKDKEICLKYLIIESHWENNIKNVTFNIKNNKLSIVSNNDNIRWDWIVDNEIIELLKLSPDVLFKYESKAT